MKYTLFTALALAASIQISSAVVTVNITNTVLGNAASTMLITDGGGAPLGGGSWAIGTFATAPDWSGAPAGNILAAFTQNGSEAPFAATAGVFGALGATQPTGVATATAPGDAFVNNPVYVVIGDAGTLAGSSDLIVIDLGQNWPAEVPPLGASLGGTIADGTILRGTPTIVTGAPSPGPLAIFNGDGGVSFGAVIPEPGVAALGLIGFLGILRRRR